MFLKIDILGNFARLTRKHLCWSLFLIKLQAKLLKTFFYRKYPVAVFVAFAIKQINIQCYNDNFGLYYNQKLSRKYCNYYQPPYIKISPSYQKYAHLVQTFCSLSHLLFPSANFLIFWSIYFCIISIFLGGSGGVSHSYLVSLIVGLSKLDCPIY